MTQVDVTPPVGIYARSWGAARHEAAEGVHRPFVATVLTLQSEADSPPLVLIGLDAGWWQTGADEKRLRGALVSALDLDAARLIINLSHTHAGASLSRGDEDKTGGQLIGPYAERVQQSLIEVTQRALAESRPGYLAWGQGWSDLAQNRDLPDPNAPADHPRRVCGWNPVAPADGTILVGRVTDPGGQLRAILVNYACHPTTLAWQNRLLSPDWIGAMRQTVEEHCGAPCLFLQGASGELAPREQYTGDLNVADRHGRQLGFAVLSALEAMPSAPAALVYRGVVESGAPLAIWELAEGGESRALEARLVPVELELKDLPATATILAEMHASTDPVQIERLSRKSRVRDTVGDGTTWELPLWIWRLGEAVLVAGPHEAYSVWQTELRAALAPHPVLALNISNGSVGYLPPAELYSEDIYAVWQSPFARGGLERVMAASLRESRALLEMNS